MCYRGHRAVDCHVMLPCIHVHCVLVSKQQDRHGRAGYTASCGMAMASVLSMQQACLDCSACNMNGGLYKCNPSASMQTRVELCPVQFAVLNGCQAWENWVWNTPTGAYVADKHTCEVCMPSREDQCSH